MADEIRLANVIRMEQKHGQWYATVGPPEYSLRARGIIPLEALARLAILATESGWQFDETWVDRLE